MRCSLLCLTALLAVALCGAARLAADEPEQQFAQAAGAYGKQQWDQACQAFAKWLAENPQHQRAGQARFFYGEALAQLERWGEARQQFSALLAQDPEHRYARQALFRSGEAAFLAGDAAAAKTDLTAFRAKYPDDSLNGYALPYLASLALESGDFAAAKLAFADALERFQAGPLADECRLGLARSQQRLGELDSARRGYATLAEAGGPLADQALYDGGTMENKLGDYAAAATILERLANQFPKSPLVPRAQLARAYAYYKLQKFPAAEALLVPLQANSQLRIDAHYWLGLSQKGQGNWAAASRTLLAVAGEPKHRLQAALAYHAADALLHDRQLPAAREQFMRALAADPQGVWADDCLLGLLRVAVEQGQHDECLRLCSEFSQQFPDSPLRGTVELAAGQALAAREDYAAAAQTLAALLDNERWSEKMAPEQRDEARRTLGLCQARLGNLEQADATLATLEPAPSSSTSGAEARYQLAEAAYTAGKWDLAAEQFARLVTPGNPPQIVRRALSGLGWAHYKANRWSECADALDRLLREFPDSPATEEALLVRGGSLENLQQWEAALAMYEQLLSKHPKSTRTNEALWHAGMLHERMKQSDRAIERYQQIIAEPANFGELDGVLHRCACLLRAAGRSEQADALFARLRQEFPNSEYAGDALLRRAERAIAEGQHDEAEQLLAGFDLSQAPPEVEQQARYLRGRAALGRGKWDEVESSLAPLCERFPQCDLAPTAAYLLAEAAYRRGDYPQAIARFVALNTPRNAESQSWAAAAELRRAQALAQLKQWDEAVDVADQIAERFPAFAETHEVDYLIGRAKAAQADFAGAREAYAKVLASQTGQKTQTAALAQWMTGESYFHQENFASALAEYSKLKDHPFPRLQAAALLQAAKCHEHLQQWPQAVASYEQLLKDHPDSELCADAQDLLREARRHLAGGAPKRK